MAYYYGNRFGSYDSDSSEDESSFGYLPSTVSPMGYGYSRGFNFGDDDSSDDSDYEFGYGATAYDSDSDSENEFGKKRRRRGGKKTRAQRRAAKAMRIAVRNGLHKTKSKKKKSQILKAAWRKV